VTEIPGGRWLEGRRERAVQRFVEQVAELADAWREHLDENDGEALPHVFFGDVRRFVAANAETWDASLHQRFWSAVEEMAAAGGDVANIVDVSLAEDLVLGDERERRALEISKPYLGEATRASVEHSERWRGD
jgi:hypothetical protein